MEKHPFIGKQVEIHWIVWDMESGIGTLLDVFDGWLLVHGVKHCSFGHPSDRSTQKHLKFVVRLSDVRSIDLLDGDS